MLSPYTVQGHSQRYQVTGYQTVNGPGSAVQSALWLRDKIVPYSGRPGYEASYTSESLKIYHVPTSAHAHLHSTVQYSKRICTFDNLRMRSLDALTLGRVPDII